MASRVSSWVIRLESPSLECMASNNYLPDRSPIGSADSTTPQPNVSASSLLLPLLFPPPTIRRA